MPRVVSVILVVAAVFVAEPAEAQCSTLVTTSPGGSVQVLTFAGTSGTAQTLETTGITGTMDPMLRLFSPAGVEVARDLDAGPGNNARVTFTLNATGTWVVVVHAESNSSGGTAQVLRNGALMPGGAFTFGGFHASICGVSGASQVRTVFEQAGPRAHVAVVAALNGSVATGAAQLLFRGRPEESMNFARNSTAAIGVVFAPSPTNPGNGMMTVVRNGSTDTDGDGVANDVEGIFDSCASGTGSLPSGWNCANSTSPLDTDRDGLLDSVEIFGDCDATECVAPRRWGAVPDHKDAFVELDGQNLNTPTLNATWAQGVYDRSGVASAIGNGTKLFNPDGVQGISFHFDYAGYLGSPLSFTNTPFLLFNNTDDSAAGSSTTTNCANDLTRANWTSPLRRSVYRWVCVTGTFNGFSSAFPQSPPFALAEGDVPGIVMHEIGHNLGLQHGGIDALLGKPNYRSLMNYNHQNTGTFYSAGTRDDLDPLALTESAGTGASNTYLTSEVGFAALAGGVDWTGNGSVDTSVVRGRIVGKVTSPDIRPVETDVVTESNQVNDAIAMESPAPCATPAVVRWRLDEVTRVHVFWAACGSVSIQHINAWMANTCPQPFSSQQCFGSAPGGWSPIASTGRFAESVAGEVFTTTTDGQAIYLATRRGATQTLRILRGVPTIQGEITSLTVVKEYANTIIGEPDIQVSGSTLHVVFQEADGEVFEVTMGADGVWSATPTSTGVTSTQPPALDHNTQNSLLYMATADSNGTLRIFAKSGGVWQASGAFNMPDDVANLTVFGKPGFSWVPDRVATPSGSGYFSLILPKNSNGSIVRDLRVRSGSRYDVGQVRAFSFITGSGAGTWLRATSGDETNGLAIIATPRVEGPGLSGTPGLVFFPYATGFWPIDVVDHDDQAEIRDNLCPSLETGLSCDSNGSFASLMSAPPSEDVDEAGDPLPGVVYECPPGALDAACEGQVIELEQSSFIPEVSEEF